MRCRGRWLGKGIGLKNTFVIPARGVFRHGLGEEDEEGWGRRGGIGGRYSKSPRKPRFCG